VKNAQQLEDGRWVPAVPLPYFGRTIFGRRKFVCWEPVPDAPFGVLSSRRCGASFKGEHGRVAYEAHYRERYLAGKGES
jgi:hypothetical protein